MDEKFPSNSNKSKEKKVEKVVSGKVKKKSKFLDIIFSEDFDSVKDYIIFDVVIPNAKKILSEIVTKGSDMLLYGEARSTKNSNASKVSYRSYYNSETPQKTRTSRYSFDDILLDSRGEAEEVLFRMEEILDIYGIVSVADFYELVGVNDGTYTDNNYGWTDLRTAKVVRMYDGYMIKFPRPVPLN